MNTIEDELFEAVTLWDNKNEQVGIEGYSNPACVYIQMLAQLIYWEC